MIVCYPFFLVFNQFTSRVVPGILEVGFELGMRISKTGVAMGVGAFKGDWAYFILFLI